MLHEELQHQLKEHKNLTQCLNITMNTCKVVTSLKVKDDYTEKQSIQWWHINDLETVMKNGGFINNDFFRAYFLPVLDRSIKCLKDLRQNIKQV